MLCDKNYTCQKQAQSEMDKQSNESEKCTKTYINETSKRTKQKEDERHANIVACQPNCTNYYKKKKIPIRILAALKKLHLTTKHRL